MTTSVSSEKGIIARKSTKAELTRYMLRYYLLQNHGTRFFQDTHASDGTPISKIDLDKTLDLFMGNEEIKKLINKKHE